MNTELQINKILVPTDFSAVSLNALEHAAYIASRLGAEIHLLHVMESYEYNVELDKDFDSSNLLQIGIKEKMEEVKRGHEDLKKVKVTSKVEKGKIHRKVRDYIQQENIDLMIMGAYGASSVGEDDRHTLGTNTYKLIHAAACPVITVREKSGPVRFKDIVLPLDITKETRQKIGLAIRWAKTFDSTIHVISVSNYLDEFRVDLNKLRAQLNAAADRITQAGVKCNTKMLRHENIANSVLDYSKEVNADLIIILTRAETKWNEFIVGSSAKRVITDANVPVMSVHPKE